MAILFVQSLTAIGDPGTGTYTSAAFGSSTTSGNLIVVTVSDDGGTLGGITSVTDSKSNTYTKVPNEFDGASTVSVWYAKNITGGASHTITVNYNTSITFASTCVAQEFSGVDTTAPLDVYTSTGGTGTSTTSGATGTTAQNDELVIGSLAFFGATTTVTLGSGYTNLGTTHQTNAGVGMESKVVSSTGTQTATFTLGLSRGWSTAVTTFKAASTGSPSASLSPSASQSPSSSASSSISPSASSSLSLSPSASLSPSSSVSLSLSPSASQSPSSSASSSSSVSSSVSPSASKSPSSSISASPSPGYTGYSRGDYASLPVDDFDLEVAYTQSEVLDVATSDNFRVAQTATSQYAIHQFKNFAGTSGSCIVTWEGQSNLAPSLSPMVLQIYNVNTASWETLSANTSASANVDFQIQANVPVLGNYKDVHGVITCRVYQLSQ